MRGDQGSKEDWKTDEGPATSTTNVQLMDDEAQLKRVLQTNDTYDTMRDNEGYWPSLHLKAFVAISKTLSLPLFVHVYVCIFMSESVSASVSKFKSLSTFTSISI